MLQVSVDHAIPCYCFPAFSLAQSLPMHPTGTQHSLQSAGLCIGALEASHHVSCNLQACICLVSSMCAHSKLGVRRGGGGGGVAICMQCSTSC